MQNSETQDSKLYQSSLHLSHHRKLTCINLTCLSLSYSKSQKAKSKGGPFDMGGRGGSRILKWGGAKRARERIDRADGKYD